VKDALFNAAKVGMIAGEIHAVYPDFDKEAFEKDVLKAFSTLELKARIFHIRDMLKQYLPEDFEVAVGILLDALPKELDPKKCDDDFGDFIYAPYSEYVTAWGCCDAYVDFSLKALGEITKRFSVEFAIRDFINSYPEKTLVMLEECSTSDNYHQRRLASEGTRIRLPWAKGLKGDYHDRFFLLENLYHDKCRFVTRSVANHLNDISKIDAPLVLKTLSRWKKSKKQNPKEMAFIINHALRTLVKEGDKEALAFLGYRANPTIVVKNFALERDTIMIGEALVFSFDVLAKREEGLIIDYILHFRMKNGKLSPKVHKLKKLHMRQGEEKFSKKHLFKVGMTTRKLYAGEHKIELQINGHVVKSALFNLNLVK
jgi:3-methyladenine DNA glycosylase AlkC